MVQLNKAQGDYKTAMQFSDSLQKIEGILRQKLDLKILNQAVQKTESERHAAELRLLESQKSLTRLRFYALIAVLLGALIITALLFNRYRLKKIHQMALAELEKVRLAEEKKQTEEKLKQAEELLAAYTNTIKEKTSLIESLDIELHRQKETPHDDIPDLQSIAANREKLISGAILTDDDWRHFRSLFEQVYPGFLLRLRDKYPDLSPAELRLLILTKLNLSSREMANMLGVSIEAIRKARYRMRKKLDLKEESNLEALIQQI